MNESDSNPWQIGTIISPALTWGDRQGNSYHRCRICNIELLTGERAGFCCGNGGKYFNNTIPLPPLPPQYDTFINNPDISSMSRVLNLIFSFASMETTHPFPVVPGPPGFLAIQGRIYHRLRPNHENSAVRWLLYDGFMCNMLPFRSLADALPPNWITALRNALLAYNPLVGGLFHLSVLDVRSYPNAHLTLEDTGTATEIAAVMNYENTTQSEVKARRMMVIRRDGDNQAISTISRLWEPLAYPLLFPHATLGWGVYGAHSDLSFDGAEETAEMASDVPTRQIMHYRARMLREPRFRIFGRLTNEYAIDMFTRNLETRLNYIRANQKRLRDEDATLMGVTHVADCRNIYLPASFLGSRRWATEQISDSLAVAASYGPPTFFITMTCNTNWPEIQSQLRPGQDFMDIPVVVVRVFRRKVALLEKALKTMFPHAGGLLYCIHSIEFQKRGVPHAHILLKFCRDCITAAEIDAVVSAEIPPDPRDAALIRNLMIHRHPASNKPPSKYCQRVGEDGVRSCRFHYPHPLQPTTLIDIEGRVHYRRRNPDDEWVVPHCLPLLQKFQCHLNFEVANSSHLFQYLFKYIHKGPDHAKYRVHIGDENEDPIDEIDDYWKARYLTAGEATWRILGYNITKMKPAVTAISIHGPSSHSNHQYHRRDQNSSTLSTLDHYFLRPHTLFTIGTNVRDFANLTYTEYYTLFRLAKYDATQDHRLNYYIEEPNSDNLPPMHVILRSAAHPHISRIRDVRPSEGDLFYLRALLQHRPASSYVDARTVNGIEYATFQEAATELGLFANEKESEYALMEAIQTLKTPRQLRLLFVHLLVNDCVPTPLAHWETFQENFALDFTLQNHNALEIGMDHALQEIGQSLEEYGKTLGDYGLPEPMSYGREVEHEYAKWSADRDGLSLCADNAVKSFNPEQRLIYDLIITAVIEDQPLCIFIDGKAGTGKTYLVQTICNKIRSLARIVLPTATSAFAAQHYPGGRTTHSAFKVPVNENNEMLVSPIQPESPRGELIRDTSVIIWDEAPMANRAVLACIYETCQRIMQNDAPFGGKILVLLGDFRQTCPVIRRGSRAQIVDASIKSSPLWSYFTVYRLHRHRRNAGDPLFAEFVDAIGDGAGPDIPLTMLNIVTNPEDIIQFVYADNVLQNSACCLSRAILAPTNLQVDQYNDVILQRVHGTQRTYLAADTLKEVDNAGLISPDSALDYVARQTPPGLPSHTLTIKINGVYRLLRNFSLDRGLVKNVRVVVVDVGSRLVTVRLIRPSNSDSTASEDGEDILIPRITFLHQLPSGHTLLRRQFPLAPAYATTFNSCQGLTLDFVGVDLTRPVFSHGQLYTALSRIRQHSDAIVRLHPGQTTTPNVTYKEILI